MGGEEICEKFPVVGSNRLLGRQGRDQEPAEPEGGWAGVDWAGDLDRTWYCGPMGQGRVTGFARLCRLQSLAMLSSPNRGCRAPEHAWAKGIRECPFKCVVEPFAGKRSGADQPPRRGALWRRHFDHADGYEAARPITPDRDHPDRFGARWQHGLNA